MMQEEQTVTFQPIYEGYQPWFAKLFAVYVFIVLIVLLIRCAKFIWILLSLRKLNREDDSAFNKVWTDWSERIVSTRRLAGFTFLMSMLVFSWWTSDVLLGVRAEKTPNLAYILPAIGDALITFTI